MDGSELEVQRALGYVFIWLSYFCSENYVGIRMSLENGVCWEMVTFECRVPAGLLHFCWFASLLLHPLRFTRFTKKGLQSRIATD